MIISNNKIGLGSQPFIIAEMSGNHNHSLERALEIVDAAAESGAHAIKLQTYTADTITLDISDKEFLINDVNSLWHGKSLYELYKEASIPWEWHAPIMKRAKQKGIICFSTPFDDTAVDFLEELNVPAYKIASAEIIHLPLINKVASTGKPMIISTGMASVMEIDETVQTVRKAGCKQFALLKCTSSYPASPVNSNVLTIPHMRELFKCEVGLSDHTLGIGVAIAAVSHGATIIEKHLTLLRKDGGIDSAFSMEPSEMKMLVTEILCAKQALGRINYGVTQAEKTSALFRRSLYISMDLKKGDVLNKKNLRIVRPGKGLRPRYFDVIIGRKVNRDVKKGTPINWDLIE